MICNVSQHKLKAAQTTLSNLHVLFVVHYSNEYNTLLCIMVMRMGEEMYFTNANNINYLKRRIIYIYINTHTQVHLKKNEYCEKGQYFVTHFRK